MILLYFFSHKTIFMRSGKCITEEINMKKKIRFFLPLLAFLILCNYNGATAQSLESENQSTEEDSSKAENQVKSVQFSLWGKYQLYNADTSITMFRLNTVYGFNKDVSGLDLGGFGRVSGKFTGWQNNIVNVVNGDLRGLQIGIYNESGDSKALQVGILNTSKKTVGWQIGIINHASDINGMQFGLLYNTADALKGLQIGLLNMNWSGKPITFLPIVNFAF
jgi:hypothetical protein